MGPGRSNSARHKPSSRSGVILLVGVILVLVNVFVGIHMIGGDVPGMGFEAPFRLETDCTTRNHRQQQSLGRKIVEEAFERSYSHLIHHNCSRFATFFDCLIDFNKTTTDTEKSHWPWWFVTLIRDASLDSGNRGKRGRGLHGEWHIRSFPAENLELCNFEKGGTKQWKEISENLSKQKTKSLNNPSKQGVETKKRAVFLRDPLDRYLSAFIDKCEHNRYEEHCEPWDIFRRDNNSLALPEIQPFLDTKHLFDIYADMFPLTWNVHFYPEALSCDGLYQNLDQYDFIGSLGPNMYRDLARFAKAFPSLENATDATFHYKAKIDIHNTGVERAAATKVSKYYTPRTVKRILELYSLDYMTLGLPIPEWAETLLATEYTK